MNNNVLVLFDSHIHKFTVNMNNTIKEFKNQLLGRNQRRINIYSGIKIFSSLDYNKTLSECGVSKLLRVSYDYDPGGAIDNLKEESKSEIAKKIGFDMNLIKRNELNINLIHFDLNMTNGENYKYFNNFKVNVVGGFHAMDDITIFKKLLKKVSEKDIPFIVVSSGSSGKDIIPICQQYYIVKEVIIFCMDYEHNKHYINEYPGYVNKVVTSINELYQYLKIFEEGKSCPVCHQCSYQFHECDILMDRQIQECPVITAEEYDKCYFLVHRAYAYFFGNFENNNHSFNDENYNIIKDLLNKLDERSYFQNKNDKSRLNSIFMRLKDIKECDIFVEKSIKTYTGESIFCYLFNRMMRNIESGIVLLSYFMGPLLFELNKYVKNHKDFSFSKSMTLYRSFNCSETEFYLYKLNLNNIICFPALTSTSSKEINFEPTNLASNINKTGNDSLRVELIFKYNHESDNISPGIIIEDKEGHDGECISLNPSEKEVILFPFTFAKIISISSEVHYGKEIQIVNLEIINRKSYLEYILRDNVNERPKFSDI